MGFEIINFKIFIDFKLLSAIILVQEVFLLKFKAFNFFGTFLLNFILVQISIF